MATDLHVAVSAQITMARRMETIANNIANINTTGYRAEGVRFESVLAEAGGDPVAFATSGESYISRKAGAMQPTGNALDLAIDGDAWLGLSTPDGTVYTRDGRFEINDLGELQSVNGYAVVDPGGAPITIDPAGGPLEVSESGAISQGGRQIGSVGLFMLPETATLSRYDNSAVMSDQPAFPAEDATTNSLRQGYLERANVDPVLELTRMIEVSRAYEAASTAVENSDDTARQAIRTLASS